MTTSAIAGTAAALEAGAPIEADDGSVARILGKRPVLWVGAGMSVAAGYPTTGALLDALVAAAGDPIDRTRSFYEVKDQSDLAGARDCLERGLRIQAIVFGTERHPHVAASLHELAGVLKAQGDLPGARDLLERVLRIKERIYGTRDHWSSAITEQALADLLLQQGDENDRPRAVQLLLHAYRAYRSQLGDDHPRTRALDQFARTSVVVFSAACSARSGR